MEDSFSEPPRRSTRRVMLESKRDYESQSPVFHHTMPGPSVANRKRKLSSSGSCGGGGGGSEGGGGEGERRWVREERDRGNGGGGMSYSKRSSNTLFATRHKRSRLHGNTGSVTMDTIEVPLRRSKREKRLIFSNLNQQEIYHHMINGPPYPVMDFSEDELEPYEKILSPVRRRRRPRPGHTSSPHHSPRHSSHSSPHERSSRLGMRLRSSGLEQSHVKAEISQEGEREEEGGEEGTGGGEGSHAKDGEGERDPTVTDTEENEEGEEDKEMEEEEEEEEGGRGYYLRKRRPVVYSYQPIIQVVEDDTPPKKQRPRVRRASGSDSAYYRKSGSAHHASRAYGSKGQSSSSAATIVSRRVRRVAHAHDSSSTSSSGSDSDEARFRRRKSRSMKKSRMQCLPMNFDPSELSQPVVRDRQRIGASLADVDPMNISRNVTFDSIGGLKQHIRSLKEMILFPLLYPEVFDRFHIQPPRGVLFFGPPGCGKTLVARGLANECSRDGKRVAFFMRKGADCLSKWVGESERQLRLLFDQAYQLRPSIIFFDEIDGLAPVRSTRQDQIHSSIVSTLLALMDGLDSRGEVVVIGATNRIDAIDPALRRPGRFDREFLFPLPSREDRSSIMSIHTRHWSPPLKPSFISQLADQTVGYCGADLKSLCTEAALCALRRTYPQIYETGDKLVLDVTTINITATDFFTSLGKIVPTAQRSESSCARALPREVAPLLMRSLAATLAMVEVVFNPSWTGVEKARKGLNAAFAMELQRARDMEEQIRKLSNNTTTHHTSRSITGLSRLETGLTSSSSRQNSQISTLCDAFEPSAPSNSPVTRNAVYFQMDDVVNEVGGVDNITMEMTDNSSEVAIAPNGEETTSDNHQAMIAECPSNNPCSILGSSLSTSHPHSLPSVHRPRLLLCGAPGGGQSSHLGPALLHVLEEIPVKALDLSVVFRVTSCSPEESLVQLFKEAKRTSPSIVYLPRVDSWWGVTTETFQVTFISTLLSLPPSTSLVVIATAECQWSELCPSLKKLFSFSCETFTVPRPGREERKRFFFDALLVKPHLPPPHSPLQSTVTQLKQLSVAPPPQPRKLAPTELNKMDRHRNSVLRELRIFLREATNKLMAERKFKEFTRPVAPEEVPDYYDIVREPMDLGTIMKKIDEHQYTLPRQWLGDVDKISKNAIEYNPAHDSESRLLLHRAAALQDMAHSILEHELSEEFEQQCEDIEDTYKRLGRDATQTSDSQLRAAASTAHAPSETGDHTPNHTPSPSRSSTHSSRRESYYECRRRSLRVKGLEPEAKGFDYYSSSRTPRKYRAKEEEEREIWEEVGERREEEGEREEEEGGVREKEEEGVREVGKEREEEDKEEGEESEPLLESGYDDDEEEEEARGKRKRTPRIQSATENATSLGKSHKRRELNRPKIGGHHDKTVGRHDNNDSDDRGDTEESEEEVAEEISDTNEKDNRISLVEDSGGSDRNRHRTCNTDAIETLTDSKSASSTVFSIQRRHSRAKNRLFTRNRASPSGGGTGRCNDDVIVVETPMGGRREENKYDANSMLRGDCTARNGVTDQNDLLTNTTSSIPRRNRSIVADENSTRFRSKIGITLGDDHSNTDSPGNDVTANRRGKSLNAGDVISCNRGSGGGGAVLCNGVRGSPANLWLGGGGGEGEGGGGRDVLVDMETEPPLSQGGRNSNSKSTHPPTSRVQVSNLKSTSSATTITAATSRSSSLNSNPNSKSTLSIPSSSSTTPIQRQQESPTSSAANQQSTRKEVDIDHGRLLALFQRVVEETGQTSVEEMEKMLSTFNHLVFRYRMRTDRQQLTKDLELAADLFLRQPPTPNIHD